MAMKTLLGARPLWPFGRVLGWTAIAFLLLLSACDEGPATNTRFMHPSGARDFLIAATKNQGPLYVELSGAAFDPWPGGDADLVRIMEKAIQWRVLTLTTERAAANDGRFKLLLVINAPSTTKAFTLCEEEPRGGAARSDGRVEILAAFCNESNLIAAVHGWVEEAEEPGSQRFEQLLRQIARDLFSKRERDQ